MTNLARYLTSSMNLPDDLAPLRYEYASRELRLAGSDIYSWFNIASLFAIQQRQRAVLSALRVAGITSLDHLHILEMGCGARGCWPNFLPSAPRPEICVAWTCSPTGCLLPTNDSLAFALPVRWKSPAFSGSFLRPCSAIYGPFIHSRCRRPARYMSGYVTRHASVCLDSLL